MHLILFISLLVCTSKNQLIRNYCHNFVFLVLYRFQGSVPIRRSAARVSLHIISSSQRKVNSFFKLFLRFWRSFWFLEHSPKMISPSFCFWDVLFKIHFPKSFAILASIISTGSQTFPRVRLTFSPSYYIIRTQVLNMVEST